MPNILFSFIFTLAPEPKPELKNTAFTFIPHLGVKNLARLSKNKQKANSRMRIGSFFSVFLLFTYYKKILDLCLDKIVTAVV